MQSRDIVPAPAKRQTPNVLRPTSQPALSRSLAVPYTHTYIYTQIGKLIADVYWWLRLLLLLLLLLHAHLVAFNDAARVPHRKTYIHMLIHTYMHMKGHTKAAQWTVGQTPQVTWWLYVCTRENVYVCERKRKRGVHIQLLNSARLSFLGVARPTYPHITIHSHTHTHTSTQDFVVWAAETAASAAAPGK